MKDYYSILQIKPEATKEEIKVAYRKLAKKYHPDVNGGAQWAEERFKELQEAYSVLSDYFEKAEYDRKYAAYYKRETGSTPRYSSAENTPRSQAASPNRPTPPKPSTPPKQASGSKPYDTAQANKSFGDYVRDTPRKAKAFSHWMNFDKSSKNSIYDGIKSDKKLNFEFANKVAAWFRLLIVFGQFFGITALIVIFLMDGQKQLENVFGTKLSHRSHASTVEYAYWIDDASGITHSKMCPKYKAGKGHGSNTATSKRCDCSYCQPDTTAAGKYHRERSSVPADEANDNGAQDEAEQATAHEANKATTSVPSGYKSSAGSDDISSYRPHDSSHSGNHSPVSSETSTEAATQAQTEQKPLPVSERITDSDWECADGSEPEDFWITEVDDTTHNSSCSRYGMGEGMYSAQGSGTDCTECDGGHSVSQKRETPDDKENAQTKTSASSSASASQQAPDNVVYWQSLDDGLVHHPSCSQYCNGRGYYTTTTTGKHCPKCGGMYWITDVNGKTHNASCTWFGKYKGHYSSEGTGHNCQECGGAR